MNALCLSGDDPSRIGDNGSALLIGGPHHLPLSV